MNHPWLKTIERLSLSTNRVSIDVLTAGLQVAHKGIAAGCLGGLLCKNHSRVFFDIIRNYHTYPPHLRAVVEQDLETLAGTVRQAVLHGEPSLRDNALDLIRQARDIQQMTLLLMLLEKPDEALRDRVIETVRSFVDLLYLKQCGPHEAATDASLAEHPAFRDLAHTRAQAIAALETACQRYESHHCLEVIEWLALLGDVHDLSNRRVFSDRQSLIPDLLRQVLAESKHPGILRLLLATFDDNYPPLWVLRIAVERDDPEFACAFLRSLPRKPSGIQAKNYREIKGMAWLEAERFPLEAIPPTLHATLVSFVMHTGLPLDSKLAALEWVVRHGSPQGRLAATDVLCRLEDEKVQEVVLDSLGSEEPKVQAWATSQLRPRDIRNCFELLVERLDSPFEEVRRAARAELSDFGVPRVLEMFSELDPARCRGVGQLLLKIDPDAPYRLNLEMAQAVRRRRIRAAHCAEAIGLLPLVMDGLVEMTQDSDALVRRTGIEALAKLNGPRVESMLSAALSDPSPRVREAAERAVASRMVTTSPGPSGGST